MKFSTASTVALTLSSLWGDAIAFAPAAKLHAGAKSSGRRAGARFMAMDMDMPATVQDAPAPATRAAESLPVIQSRGGAPVPSVIPTSSHSLSPTRSRRLPSLRTEPSS